MGATLGCLRNGKSLKAGISITDLLEEEQHDYEELRALFREFVRSYNSSQLAKREVLSIGEKRKPKKYTFRIKATMEVDGKMGSGSLYPEALREVAGLFGRKEGGDPDPWGILAGLCLQDFSGTDWESGEDGSVNEMRTSDFTITFLTTFRFTGLMKLRTESSTKHVGEMDFKMALGMEVSSVIGSVYYNTPSVFPDSNIRREMKTVGFMYHVQSLTGSFPSVLYITGC